MKILIINRLYQSYINYIYTKYPQLPTASYYKQRDIIDSDFFAWNKAWNTPFEKLGFTAEHIYTNIIPLQNKWAQEFTTTPYEKQEAKTVEKQIEFYKPDILFTDDVFNYDGNWVEYLKNKFSFIKLAIGHIGSPSYVVPNIKQFDFLFSCLRSIEQQLTKNGIKSAHIPHAFNAEVLNKINNPQHVQKNFCFYGGFARGSNGHGYREELLEFLLQNNIGLDIYSDVTSLHPLKDFVTIKGKKLLYRSYKMFRQIGISERWMSKMPLLSHAARWENFNSKLFSSAIRKSVKPALFGLDLYNTLVQYKAVLNIHGDLAKTEAANMRMFEVAGAGSCLITDWKQNLNELFEDEKEILSYKTKQECIEKMKWILENPEKTAAIGKNGQLRILKDHTFNNRAERIVRCLKEYKLL